MKTWDPTLENLVQLLQILPKEGLFFNVTEGAVEVKKGTLVVLRSVFTFAEKEVQEMIGKIESNYNIPHLIKLYALKQVTEKGWRTKHYTPYCVAGSSFSMSCLYYY